MSGRRKNRDMVTKTSNKQAFSRSTPDHTFDSPSRDSDSICDSQTLSPVPLPCTQEGPEPARDVVWNFGGTNLKHSVPLNSTPDRSKKKRHRSNLSETRQQTVTRRKNTRLLQRNTQLPPELLELNVYVKHNFIEKKGQTESSSLVEKPRSGSEDDIFSESATTPKRKSQYRRCLRKNVLSPKVSWVGSENGLESDDSMNECLIQATQATEEIILNETIKQSCFDCNTQREIDSENNDDSLDAILKEIRTPQTNQFKVESPGFKNDSFDVLCEELSTSTFERLTQMPLVNGSSRGMSTCNTKDTSTSGYSIARHNSMPESPSSTDHNRPASSGMTIGRFKSMPHNDRGESPIRCSPLEIQKKRQQAREKLLAKKLPPFSQIQPELTLPAQSTHTRESPKKGVFEPKVPKRTSQNKTCAKPELTSVVQNTLPTRRDLLSLIEMKRLEALKKLQRKKNLKSCIR